MKELFKICKMTGNQKLKISNKQLIDFKDRNLGFNNNSNNLKANKIK